MEIHNFDFDCNWSTANGHAKYFLIILFITRFFQPSHYTKRKARSFIALNRHKNTAGGRECGINVVYPIFVFMQIRDILLREAKHYEINIFVLNRVTV